MAYNRSLPYLRQRSRSDLPTEGMLEQIGISNISDASYGPHQLAYKNETMADVVTPGYDSIIRRGGIVNNSCEYVVSERTSSGSGSQRIKISSYEWELVGAVTLQSVSVRGMGSIPTVTVNNGNADAKAYALKQMDATPYGFGEDVGEIGETLRFLRSPLKSLSRLSKEYRKDITKVQRKRKIHPRERDKLYQAHADVYLSYRFAVSPLVRSASDLLESFDKRPRTPPERRTARGFAQDSSSESGDSTVVQSGTSFDYKHYVSRSRYDRAAILYKVSNPVYDWRWRYGLRAKDVPETVWQLVPYSFMIDRVYDVSGFVRGVTNLADPSLSILAASVTRKEEYIHKYTHTVRRKSGMTCTGSGETVTDRDFTYQRTTWSPSWSDAVPRFKPLQLVDDATKIADLTSLIISNFRR